MLCFIFWFSKERINLFFQTQKISKKPASRSVEVWVNGCLYVCLCVNEGVFWTCTAKLKILLKTALPLITMVKIKYC